MKVLFKFLLSQIRVIVAYFVFSIVFTVVFYLLNLPLDAVLYAFLLCAVIGSVFIVISFLQFLFKHKELMRLRKEIGYSIDNMPKMTFPIEKDFSDIIITSFNNKQKLSDEMSRKYSELVEYYTVWAHQIKTPIAAMRLILQGSDYPENKELLDELQRIEQYVEMVLCYLRLDSNSTDYIFKKYKLDSIIKQAVKKYASQFIRRKIKLDYTETDIEVLTDEKWLLFVIEQLLSNALKYTKKGTIKIYIQDESTLVISDSGIGIAAEDLPRIFEKGFTGQNGRNDKKSTGIGLYLCGRIIKNLHSEISVSSAPAKGTEVYLKLDCDYLEIE